MQVRRIAGHVGAKAGMASIVGAAALLVAAPGPRQAPADRFIVKDVMIPARDGVKLHTKIWRCKEPRK